MTELVQGLNQLNMPGALAYVATVAGCAWVAVVFIVKVL